MESIGKAAGCNISWGLGYVDAWKSRMIDAVGSKGRVTADTVFAER